MPYPFQEIEPKWQAYWDEHKTFKTPDLPAAGQEKMYILDMFPYPSGSGLHVGHPEGYTATDITARYKRMRGVCVLHPMGWDSFGLPAEEHARKTGVHPAINTTQNIDTFKRQLKSLGFSYDWDREIATSDPDYYKWTQWIFLQLYKKGLAYIQEAPVNWCPALKTVLANEEVVDGRSEVGGHPVVRKNMKQWVLKITDYAEQLLDGLEGLDWPDSLKDMQRNWIGRSEGAEVDFAVSGHDDATIRVYTTRPDTLFGATYMVLSPEHPLVDTITVDGKRDEVKAYQQTAARKSDLERTELAKDKSGVDTGCTAINPVNGEQIPIWISDYVLVSYGTGAIMAVPAHDQRDYEFAKMFDLAIVQVIDGGSIDEQAWTGDGIAMNSANDDLSLDGKPVAEAKQAITDWLAAKNLGEPKVNYKLRDWLFARQRYWGEPFPIVYVDGDHHAIAESDLPLIAPEMESYEPGDEGLGPLSRATDWMQTTLDGKPAVRETNTMPQWAGSCWYYLRFIDPLNEEKFIDPEKEKAWMPVDLYIGGAEHAVLHLLYARFWHKVLFDCGLVSTSEPFQKLVNQGIILGDIEFSVRIPKNHPVTMGPFFKSLEMKSSELVDYDEHRIPVEEVVKDGNDWVLKSDPSVKVVGRAYKMSKSRGNVVNPDDVVEQYGADSLRLYEMFMGPLEQVKPWSMAGVSGVFKFLDRSWRTLAEGTVSDIEANPDQLRILHSTIKRVTEAIETLRFNVGIAAMMEFVNAAAKWDAVPKSAAESFVLLLSPYAPHIAEELWSQLGHSESLAYEPWPVFDEAHLASDTFELIVQVNGKLRARLQIPSDAEKEDILTAAKASEDVKKHLDGKTIRKEIVVPRKLVNFVVT